MQAYDIKRGHNKNIEGDKLKEIMEENFGAINQENENLVASFGAMKKLNVWMENKKLCIETEMDKKVSDETAMKTIKAYNIFLFMATGFTSKERKKRLNKKAKEGNL